MLYLLRGAFVARCRRDLAAGSLSIRDRPRRQLPPVLSSVRWDTIRGIGSRLSTNEVRHGVGS